MLDFKQIRSLGPGQRYAFEELVCQLGRREPTPSGSRYRRIEGAGGDGGVEAYWLLPDGNKIGYQAKFFTKSRDIDWAQIDDSVQQAINIHETLVEYVIAIPCDLTERTGRKSTGKTGWEQWEAHSSKWQKDWLAPQDRQIKFVPWTAFDLQDKLISPAAEGLRQYWFGVAEFSKNWFERQVQLAVAALEERYHPEDHVDVHLENLFHFMTRDATAVAKLRERISAVRKAPFPTARLNAFKELPKSELQAAETALEAFLAVDSELDLPFWEEWQSERWAALAADLMKTIGDLNFALRRTAEKPDVKLTKEEDDRLRATSRQLYGLIDAVEAFRDLVAGPYLTAERARVALIKGRAGSGKSHLLGRVAEIAAKRGSPTILLLGQQMTDQPIWQQITQRLSLGDCNPDSFLQAFDAAGEAAGKRSLLLIDALNEGAGARLWRPELAQFLARVAPFRNLICVVTCRSEYVPYVIPEGVLQRIQSFEIKGFETRQEQLQAARIYLDKRGISRPSTPWLAPEFVNPLFLRSACLALSREKKTQFPKGLRGTKELFAFYINSVARNLGVGRDGTTEFVSPTMNALRVIAARMAADRKDYISRAAADEIAHRAFSVAVPSGSHSWLEVLHRNGLVRFDPDPDISDADPLRIPDDVIRFSFQRLQDHLIAERLLIAVSAVTEALKPDGQMGFIYEGKGLAWQWQGLVEALSIQIPEKFGVEFVDALPQTTRQWWNFWQIRDAFGESVRWRDKEAFSDRTLELFNQLWGSPTDPFTLLIEFCASTDHPWNAEFLHKNLLGWKLPRRDRLWTTRLNESSSEEDHPVERLIDWSLVGQTKFSDVAAQRLCAMTLCWLFTSSNRYIRDRATKALTSLLISNSSLFSELPALFRTVDDIYVLERLFAAAYGACCIDPAAGRLEAYAATTFKWIFAASRVPPCLLLRDYARGIIELCAIKSELPADIDLKRCRPPYGSAPPRLNVSEDLLEQIAAKAGDKAILWSCEKWGDFGRYEIETRITHFTRVRLAAPQPISDRNVFDRFEVEVVNKSSVRREAFAELRKASIPRVILAFGEDDAEDSSVTRDEDVRWAHAVLIAERDFNALLSADERNRYKREARSYLELGGKKTAEIPRVDIPGARRWIAARAYRLGWNKRLFPGDSYSKHEDHSRGRSVRERIGKKYQWIALEELLCGLADNYWVGGEYGEPSKPYDTPLDVGFERDIDPTVIPLAGEVDNSQGERPRWVFGEEIVLEAVDDHSLLAWPAASDPAELAPNLIRRTGDSGRDWLVLYHHRSAHEGKKGISDGPRQQEFHIMASVIVPKSEFKSFIKYFEKTKKIDVSHWQPADIPDGPFLREAPWRNIWPQEQWGMDNWPGMPPLRIAFPLYRYVWESHLDESLRDGASAYIPSPWLAKALSMMPCKNDGSLYRTNGGDPVFIGGRLSGEGSSALIDAQLFQSFLDGQNWQCVWLFVGERNVWPGGDFSNNATWRRSEALCWIEKDRPQLIKWKEDHSHGGRTRRRSKEH